MNCSIIENLFYDYVAGRLDKQQSQAVDAHIESCEDCKAQVEAYRETISALDQWEPPALPEDAADKLVDRIFESRSQRPAKQHTNWKEWIRNLISSVRIHIPVQAMAVIVVAVSVMFVYNQTRKPGVIEKIPRKVSIESEDHDSVTPLIINVGNMDQTLEEVLSLVKELDGRLVRKMPKDGTIIIVFFISPENESVFWKRLRAKGNAITMNQNYKDEKGNLHLQLNPKK